MNRLRVYHLITELRPAGAERVLHYLATGLDPERFQVAAGSLAGGGEVAEWLREAGIPVTELGVIPGRPRTYGRGFWRLVRDLRTFRPHLLHTHLFHAGLAGRLAARLAGVPHVVSHVHIVERRERPWRHRVDRLTAGLIDREICVSQAVARHRSEDLGLPGARITVIPNGVDLERPCQTQPAPADLRLAPDRPRVLAIGRLDRQKGFDLLVEAVPDLRARFPRLEVLIAGEGPERLALQERVGRLQLGDTVQLAGHREEIGPLLAAADVVAIPSRWEGFGLVAVEAMAAGRAIVAAAVDSLPEILEPESAGLLVPPEDAQALAAAIGGLLADPGRRQELGRRAVRAAQSFGIHSMVARCAALYLELLGEPDTEVGSQ
jgi:glycosyltransferase involved in cell wall biosynthesis